MSAAVVNTLQPGLEPHDCAICALAAYTGKSYTDVLRVAVAHDEAGARKGLHTRAIKRVAAELGVPVVTRRRFNPEQAYGIVLSPNHAAVVRRGLVLDRDQVFPWAEWRKVRKGRVLLLAAED
jgi:hypothetical protein